jgi:hypothetical protein
VTTLIQTIPGSMPGYICVRIFRSRTEVFTLVKDKREVRQALAMFMVTLWIAEVN